MPYLISAVAHQNSEDLF
jgi:hypothetical protein